MSTVTVEKDGHVLLIGVDRAAKRNAWNLAVIARSRRRTSSWPPTTTCGWAWSSATATTSPPGWTWPRCCRRCRSTARRSCPGTSLHDPFGLWGPPVPKPGRDGVQGIAFTLSIELALASDVVVAADDVRFRQLEVGRGILPFGGATLRRPRSSAGATRCAGSSPARSSAPPRRTGSASCRRSCRPAAARPRHRDRAADREGRRRSASTARLANARIACRNEEAAREHLAGLLPPLLVSEDAAEGVQSFVERREARFTGR
jgi:enoyl-CoA hydratase/carnithine racemase